MPYIIPHTFKAGEKAIAEQVNDNFNYIKESMDQISSTLGAQINSSQESLSEQIESIESQSQDLLDLISDRDKILKLGTIVTPDPTQDGQIPTADISLTADKVHSAAIVANSQIILPTISDNTKFVNILFEFTIAEDKTLTLPLNIKWQNGEIPSLTADGVTINRLFFDTTTGGTNWCGIYSSFSVVEG